MVDFLSFPQSINETNKVSVSYDENGNKIVNEYFFKESIGKGAYSKVKRAISLQTKKEYAVKILNIRLLKKKKKAVSKSNEGTLKINYMLEDALNEIEIYKAFPSMNDNILKLYEILIDEVNEKTYLVMELAEWGNIVLQDESNGVFTINSHYEQYDEKIIKGFIIDIGKAIQYLHMNNIAHRDIKSDNIFINSEGRCKVGDFGMAINIGKNEDVFTKTEGNVYFYPPEFCDEKQEKSFALKPVDIWSFGVTIYTCIYKRLPFLPGISSNFFEFFALITEAKYNSLYIIDDINRVDYELNGIKISNELKFLLENMLEKDPKKRYTINQILGYPWLNTY